MLTLDCQKLACPEPVLRSRALLESQQPQECTILVDNDIAATNVQRFWQQQGYAVTVTNAATNLWHICVAKHAAAAQISGSTSPSDAPCACTAAVSSGTSATEEKTVVLITTETLGRGDDVLGSKLMGTFLNTLPELGEQLWRVILLNGGVRLTAQEGPALEALQKLVDAGVTVLVCGTCLAHFGLTEKKAVGETSNMLDIVTSLQLASKVIRP